VEREANMAISAVTKDFVVKHGLVVSTTATILGTENSVSTSTGALIVAGGAGIGGNLNAQNVFVLTQYNGLDPEINGGIDNNLYPRPRTFVLGVNLDF
jgi:iron complex outermembrane receptor protein